MGQPTPNAALRQLEPLVGEWEMWALSDGNRVGPARSTFAWLENAAFVSQHTDVSSDASLPGAWQKHAPFPIASIIGFDDRAGHFTMLYADGRGVARVYGVSLSDGIWKIWRAAEGFHQRFTATFSKGGDTISGGWESSEDGFLWEPDFEMTYTRIA